ncbi:MAG: purine-nucleoside phosphorylase [Spirochaetales bacterium]|uniref:Purine nucleoside phosphorylase n=1 Tax=Candidatus Thalassospirochaeta sargassi TaxID=3119039 RepID=A0AAJ1IG90_9SPIO|nr:purine-nucleoside phosphorylase [Spirochaetales bacterium]
MDNIIDSACDMVKTRIGKVPDIALVLGSGLGSIAGRMRDGISIPYSEIPGFSESTAPGHTSRLVCGYLNKIKIIILQGRFHYYEGYRMEQITYPVRFLKKLGCSTLFLTNASGGINRRFTPGDLMLITDHINLTGQNPLIGPNDITIGERFPDMTRAYSPELIDIAEKSAAKLGIGLQKGVYAWMSGPSFETPAEIRMLEIIGADTVGMSTVPEVIAASHAGLKVIAISCISNMAAGILEQPVSAEEVNEVGNAIAEKFAALISAIIQSPYLSSRGPNK